MVGGGVVGENGLQTLKSTFAITLQSRCSRICFMHRTVPNPMKQNKRHVTAKEIPKEILSLASVLHVLPCLVAVPNTPLLRSSSNLVSKSVCL